MTELIKELQSNNLLAKFGKWYAGKHASIPIATFIKLPEILQLQILHEFFIDEYNYAINFDSVTVIIYYHDIELVVNKLIDMNNKTGKCSSVLYKMFDLPFVDNTSAFKRGIIELIKFVTKPPF